MSFQVSQLNSASDGAFAKALESAFARTDRESKMARILASHPNFSSDLALIVRDQEEVLGAALFTHQVLRIHGTPIEAAACAPIGVTPGSRNRGAGRTLLVEGLERLSKRGCRCVTAIGAPEFFGGAGFGAAFDLYTQHVPVSLLAEQTKVKGTWRGLQGPDLEQLLELEATTWARIDGSVIRTSSELDWEASAEGSHALCFESEGHLGAYLRFRVRETVEVTDCCVRGPADIESVFALLAKLGQEHARSVVELRLPPSHPVARAAFRIGCPVEVSDFGGASVLAVLDWQGLFEDLAGTFTPRLLRAARPSLSLNIDGVDYRIAFSNGQFACSLERDSQQHVDVPEGWAPGLITGKYSGEELAFETREQDPAITDLLEALFPRRTPTWAYGPVFEIADD